eukprot:TRINITY_DN9854_c0_g1_i2.p1 TRINITY_DN9854_c0_g1~~TRINITY_DN9854_c0_g1_i2.p1  ORF type:complete len:321 (-),score=33.37 TRINITY_DN9854_c0_g1_i2:257-1081(-)
MCIRDRALHSYRGPGGEGSSMGQGSSGKTSDRERSKPKLLTVPEDSERGVSNSALNTSGSGLGGSGHGRVVARRGNALTPRGDEGRSEGPHSEQSLQSSHTNPKPSSSPRAGRESFGFSGTGGAFKSNRTTIASTRMTQGGGGRISTSLNKSMNHIQKRDFTAFNADDLKPRKSPSHFNDPSVKGYDIIAHRPKNIPASPTQPRPNATISNSTANLQASGSPQGQAQPQTTAFEANKSSPAPRTSQVPETLNTEPSSGRQVAQEYHQIDECSFY